MLSKKRLESEKNWFEAILYKLHCLTTKTQSKINK